MAPRAIGLVHCLACPAVLTDTAGRVLEANDAASRLSPQPASPGPIWEFLPRTYAATLVRQYGIGSLPDIDDPGASPAASPPGLLVTLVVQDREPAEPHHLHVLLDATPALRPPTSPSTENQPAPVNLTDARRATHELGNVLTSIHASLELAQNLASLPPSLISFLEHGVDGVRRAIRLLDEFRAAIGVPAFVRAAGSAPAPSATPASTARPEGDDEPADGSERILVVDDDPGLRTLVRAILEYRGYQVTEAEDGESAIQCAASAPAPFDLVITDLHLPGIHGEDVVRHFREQHRVSRVLVLTGGELDPHLELLVSTPGSGWLFKPFTNTQLARKVRHLLDQQGSPA